MEQAQITHALTIRSLGFRVTLGSGNPRRWIAGEKTLRRSVMRSSKAHNASSLSLPHRVIDIVRMTNSPVFVAIWKTGSHGNMTHVVLHARRISRLLCLHEKRSKAWTFITATFASRGESFNALYKVNVHGPKVLDLFYFQYAPSERCLSMSVTSFHKSSIEWLTLRLRVQRSTYSPGSSPGTSP